MHSTKEKTAFFILGGLIIGCLLLVAFRMPWMFENSNTKNSVNNSLKGMSLIAPPVYALQADSATPPLNTSQISLIAYYDRANGWTLADTVPAFVNYFDGGNYYDGIVRVWDSGYIGTSSATTDDTHIDVQVRVRADGWILAWFNQSTNDPGSIIWWDHIRDTAGSPHSYSTTLSRAIEIVYEAAGITFPGYDQIGLYDYSEVNATRLIVFGQAGSTSYTYYYTIPTNSSMTPIKLLVRAGGTIGTYNWEYGFYSGQVSLSIDDQSIYDKTATSGTSALVWGWSTYGIASFAFKNGVQHTITQNVVGYGSQNVAFIMWTG